MKQPLLRHLEQLATDRWARYGVRTLIRAAWIAVCIWCIGLGGQLLWGWPLRLDLLGALALAAIGGGVLLLLRPKVSPREAARRLDQRFDLDEQLATAVEVTATNPPPESIAGRLVAQSEQTARLLRRHIARQQRPPWNELITLVALVLVVVGLYVLVGIGRADMHGSASALPPLAQANDPAQQFPPEPSPQAEQPQSQVPDPNGQPAAGAQGAPGTVGDPQTTQALADALRDQGATRSAAEALDRGDLAGAAQQLRELADQADQLGQSARNDLADALDNAAQTIAPNDPALAEQLRQNADGLRRGGQDAAEALDDLAQAIEQLQGDQSPAADAGQDQANQPGQGDQSGQGEQQGQGAGAGGTGSGADGEQRQSDSSERLGVDGQPLPLEANDDELGPPQASDKPPTTSDTVPGFVYGDDSSDKPVQSGADPLRVPLDERDVVQGYFTP